MQRLSVELIPDPELGGFTARIPDIPAYGEGETEEQAIADLKQALQGYVEAFGPPGVPTGRSLRLLARYRASSSASRS